MFDPGLGFEQEFDAKPPRAKRMRTSNHPPVAHSLVNSKHSRHHQAMKRCLRRRAGPTLGLALLLVNATLGCSSVGDPLRERRDFSDGEGRACRATLAKSSQSGPAVSESVSCDGDAKQCSAETKSCFELSVAGEADAYAVRNCPACCLGTASSFAASDCTAVVCSADTDCIYARAECQDGVCVCPLGACG